MTRKAILVSTMLLLTVAVARWSICNAELSPQSQAAASTPSASPRYFVTIYSYQDAENHAMKSHTFATFFVVDRDAVRETHTVSWLPARFAESLRLPVVAAPGKNYTLAETLDFARRVGSDVRHWGPYEIDAPFYQAGLAQIDRLNTGDVKYKLYQAGGPAFLGRQNANCSHCIDAVGDVAGRMQTGTVRGFAVAELVVTHYRPHFRSSQSDERWYDAMVRTPETPAANSTFVAATEK